ncbi:hypothetical protein ACFYKX_10990 [Cytobacillus sp. FJAT-54145]|uniref:Fur-regulated basic protein FbpA n=1 Tax=Cytobacillus spartinae TaxID=3299023 RepID=A0ABW6KAC6_9BACI
MLVAGIFQAHKQTRKALDQRFKELGYDLANKRYVIGKTLGYLPNLKDMTIEEMRRVLAELNHHPIRREDQ